MISISGFLSQDSDNNEDWLHLKNFARVRGVPLYALRWESKDATQIENLAKAKAEDNKLSEMIS